MTPAGLCACELRRLERLAGAGSSREQLLEVRAGVGWIVLTVSQGLRETAYYDGERVQPMDKDQREQLVDVRRRALALLAFVSKRRRK